MPTEYKITDRRKGMSNVEQECRDEIELARISPPKYWDIRSILQAVVTVVALLGVAGTAVEVSVSTSVRLAEYDLRISNLEHDRDVDRKANQSYQDDMRALVGRVADILTDVRLQIARNGGRTNAK